MSELLGEARILIRPDTTAFRAQLEEQLAFAKKPVVVPVVASARGAGTATQQSFTAATRADTVAQQELSGALAVTASRTSALSAEQRAAAVTTAAQARRTSQLERGAISTGLSQFGLRGATLAASGGFIAAAAGATILIKSLRASVDAAENLRIQNERLRASVGDLIATNVNRWASGLATNFGLAIDQAVQFTATLEGLFQNFGFSADRATAMSERLVQLAADMAAFKGQGTTTTEALSALQRGLAGNGRALRTFNVFVDQSRVAQEALVETGKKQTSNLTRQELVLARYNLILRDTANQTGAFKDRSQTLSGQTGILEANVRNLELEIGGPLVDALTVAAKTMNNLFFAAGKAKSGVGDLNDRLKKDVPGLGFVESAYSGIAKAEIGIVQKFGGIPLLNRGIDALRDHAKDAGTGMAQMARDAGDASAAIDRLAEAAQHVISPLKQAQTAVTELQFQQLQIQTGLTTGGPAAELANLRKQEADQKKVIAATASGSKARRQALQDLKSIQDQEKAITDQFASDAKQRAQDAKDAASKAKAARDKADQALLSIFGVQQTRITNLQIRAQRTESLKDDIQFTIDLRKLLIRQRAEAAKRIKDLQLRAATIAADTTQIITLENQIRDLQKQQADALKAAAQKAIDTRAQILQLNIQIAQASGNKAAEAQADRAYIEFLERRIKKAKGDRLKQKQLQLELAQTRADLKKLTGEQKQSNDAAKAFFQLLQTQQGFASNLLGNLIPGFATGGLVGNASPTTSGRPPGLRQVAGGFEEARGALATQTAISGTPRGPSSGQAATTNELLRRILRTLEHLNTRTNHPEASRQRQTMNAAMDGVHGN